MHCDPLSTCFDGNWTYYVCDVVYVRYCIRDVIYMCGIEFVMRWMWYICAILSLWCFRCDIYLLYVVFVIIESKNKIKKLIFEALSGALALTLGKARNSERISQLCRVPGPGHPAKFFQKKNLCRVPHDLTPGKEITKKNKKNSLPGAPSVRHPAKKL